MEAVKEYINSKQLGVIVENATFKDLTTLKIGGNIRLLFKPYTVEKFIDFYRFAIKEGVKTIVIGKGSNVYANDNDYNGVVIDFGFFSVEYAYAGNTVVIFPKCSTAKLSHRLSKEGKAGFEFLHGIPGTIGGAVAMNAGCYGKEIKDIFIYAKCINKSGEIFILRKEDMKFSYRESIILKEEYIIIEVGLALSDEEEKGASYKKLKEYDKNRKNRQPLDQKSAGSVFKNPKGYYAWELIDKAGLRGKKIGGAQVSNKHANFIINIDQATSRDVSELLELIKAEVYKQFNIELRSEWRFVNFD